MSREVFAAALGVSASLIYDIERGKVRLSPDVLDAIVARWPDFKPPSSDASPGPAANQARPRPKASAAEASLISLYRRLDVDAQLAVMVIVRQLATGRCAPSKTAAGLAT